MNKALLRVAFVNNALYLPDDSSSPVITPSVAALLAVLNQHGYGVDEDCLHHLNALGEEDIAEIDAYVREVYVSDSNWAALTRQWNSVPTGVTFINFFITAIVNQLPEYRGAGTTLPCGHFIPDGVFDLSRYTGCPFCGRSFVSARANLRLNPPRALKVLRRWTLADAEAQARELLESRIPLDAFKLERLKNLLEGLPADFFMAFTDIESSETRSVAALSFLERGDSRFTDFLRTPADMLRTLWSVKTRSARMISPSKFKKNIRRGYRRDFPQYATLHAEMADREARLHFSRGTGRDVARWLDSLPMTAGEICVAMHPRRQMWVRFIRALRLNDQARRYGLVKLTETLDRFYRHDYSVWEGEVAKARLDGDSNRLLGLLRERPGYFARCLFDTLLDFNSERVLSAFISVADRVPVRLLVSLYNSVPIYFMPESDKRDIVLPNGRVHTADINPGLLPLSDVRRKELAELVMASLIDAIKENYRRRGPVCPGPVYISPELYNIPVPVGDRGNTIGLNRYAIPGQIFEVKGDKVRIFLHWGRGLEAQHLDMDLSCLLVGPGLRTEIAYYNLSVPGAMHSGDIQYIPDKVGAAEYIELDMPTLFQSGYRKAIFTANSYSDDTLSADTLIGWMSSDRPMEVDDNTGAAYNPADVDMLLSVNSLREDRGIVFGILDLEKHEITWLEISDGDRTLDQLDLDKIMSVEERLGYKMTIGSLIALRAGACGLALADTPAVTNYTEDNWQSADLL